MKTATKLAEMVVDFINANAAPEGRISAFCRDSWVERLGFAISEKISRVTEDMLREHDGALHVGNGCELNVRGTAERLGYLESFPAHFSAEMLAAHNRNMEELVKLRKYYGEITTALGHDNALREISHLKKRISAAQEALRLDREISST